MLSFCALSKDVVGAIRESPLRCGKQIFETSAPVGDGAPVPPINLKFAGAWNAPVGTDMESAPTIYESVRWGGRFTNRPYGL